MRTKLSAVVLSILVMLLPVPAAAAQDAGLPGGMSRFTAAIGKVDAETNENWVRLANYSFTSDGKVSESHYHWSQRERVTRSYTGVQAQGCPSRDCEVQTANGFQSTSPPEKLNGTYTVDGNILKITWDEAGTEQWDISQAIEGKLAKIEYRDSSYGATHGFGYGSSAQWGDRASMSDIAAFDHGKFEHEYYLWKTDNGDPYVDEGSGSPFWMRDWTECAGGDCLGGKNGGDSDGTEYYLSKPNSDSSDRRDTLWHWRTELADGRGEYCYTGNSHVKPMMQVIDSDGGFHGWVGVEASLSQTSPGTDSDDLGIFRISEF